MSTNLRKAQRSPFGLFWGWYVAAGGAASNFLVIGIATFGFGVFVRPMREELGWSVAAISLGISLRSFEQGLLAPATGFLVDRIGPRRMAIGGLLLLVAGLILFAQARTLTAFYVSSLVIALGQSTASFTPFSAVIVTWFRRMRGRAMGVLNTGNGAGYLVAPILAYLITTVGWRPALLISAAVIAIVGLPLTQLLKDTPEDRGLMPDGDEPILGAPARSVTGASVREALRAPAFYLLVMATAANATQGAWIVHQIPHLENVGFSTQTAALISGVYGLVQVSLRFGIGWLGDLIGRRQMYAASFVLQGVGLIVFAYLDASRIWLLPIYFAVFATGHAAWVVFQQTMVADYFGVRRFATLRGLAGALQTPVGVVAPFLAGWMFDRHGNYQLIFTIYGLIATTGAIWVMLIRRPLWVEPDASEAPPGADDAQLVQPALYRSGDDSSDLKN